MAGSKRDGHLHYGPRIGSTTMGDGVHIARFARRRCDTCGHEYNAETESIEPAGDPYGDDV